MYLLSALHYCNWLSELREAKDIKNLINMKRIILYVLASCILSHSSVAQTHAITDKGDEVILYNNGTWKPVIDLSTPEKPITTNPEKFSRGKDAVFLLKSNRIHLGFWLDPKKWNFGKATSNEDAEYQLQLKDESLQALIISEKIHIPIETLRNIVIKNAQKVSPDYHLVFEEFRIVNGLKLLYIQAEGTISDMPINFYGYYYTDSVSTLQFVTMSFNNSKSNDKKIAEELLNGLVLNEAKETISDPPKAKAQGNGYYNPDLITQGASSPYHNCKKYFAGKWHYSVMGKNISINRTLTKNTEYWDNNSYEYDVIWTDDCDYQLIFRKSSDPNESRQKPGEIMDVTIVGINNDFMLFKAAFKGAEMKGEMKRDHSEKKS